MAENQRAVGSLVELKRHLVEGRPFKRQNLITSLEELLAIAEGRTSYRLYHESSLRTRLEREVDVLNFREFGIMEGTIVDFIGRYAGQHRSQLTFATGYNRINDGGGGLFVWDDESQDGHDGGTVFDPLGSGQPGRWVRLDSSPLCVRWFGAYGDRETDDHQSVQAAFDAAVKLGRELLIDGEFYIGSESIRLPDNLRSLSVRGFGGVPPAFSVSGSRSSGLIYDGTDFAMHFGTGKESGGHQCVFSDFYVAAGNYGRLHAKGGILCHAFRGTRFSGVYVFGFWNGVGFYWENDQIGQGYATWGTVFDRLMIRSCNTGLWCRGRDTAPTRPGPINVTWINFEFENPTGHNPVAIHIERGYGNTFVNAKYSGAGANWQGERTNIKIGGLAFGTCFVGGHFERMEIFLKQVGNGSVSFLGHDVWEAGRIEAERPENVSLYNARAQNPQRLNTFVPRSDALAGLFADGSSIASVHRMSIENILPNGDFSRWPSLHGNGIPISEEETVYAGIWILNGRNNMVVERNRDALFGNFSMKVACHSDRTLKGIQCEIPDPSHYVGKRLFFSLWFKRVRNTRGAGLGIVCVNSKHEVSVKREFGWIDRRFNGSLPIRVLNPRSFLISGPAEWATRFASGVLIRIYKVFAGLSWHARVASSEVVADGVVVRMKGSEPRLDTVGEYRVNLGEEYNGWGALMVGSDKIPNDIRAIRLEVFPMRPGALVGDKEILIDGACLVCGTGGTFIDNVEAHTSGMEDSTRLTGWMERQGYLSIDSTPTNEPDQAGQRFFDLRNKRLYYSVHSAGRLVWTAIPIGSFD